MRTSPTCSAASTSAPGSWCCRRTRHCGRPVGTPARCRRSCAPRRRRCLGPSGDEPFGVVDLLSGKSPVREAHMVKVSGRQLRLGAAMLLCASASRPPRRPRISSRRCSARSAAARPRRHRSPLPFASEGAPSSAGRCRRAAARVSYGGGQAYCVRSCDGRYFPITGPDNQSRAASCNSFCPASETRLVYGSNIDSAATESRQALFGTAERLSLSQRDRRGLHLQRQGPVRAGAGQDRERSRPCARATSSPAPTG